MRVTDLLNVIVVSFCVSFKNTQYSNFCFVIFCRSSFPKQFLHFMPLLQTLFYVFFRIFGSKQGKINRFFFHFLSVCGEKKNEYSGEKIKSEYKRQQKIIQMFRCMCVVFTIQWCWLFDEVECRCSMCMHNELK